MDKQTETKRDSIARVTILGARGSIPVSGPRVQIFGGGTSCVLVELGTAADGYSQALVFDAGSGFLNLPERIWEDYPCVHVFLSHFHLDHLLGIPMSRMLFDPRAKVCFYAQDSARIPEVFAQLMAQPLWPVGPQAFQADIGYRSITQEQPVSLADSIKVSALPMSHPGGVGVFRVDFGEKTIVYATDCEPDETEAGRLAQFARGTELLIIDAQYTSEEESQCRGFGHMGMHRACELVAASGAKQGLLFHHAPSRTDTQLEELNRQVQKRFAQISFAREGGIITL